MKICDDFWLTQYGRVAQLNMWAGWIPKNAFFHPVLSYMIYVFTLKYTSKKKYDYAKTRVHLLVYSMV